MKTRGGLGNVGALLIFLSLATFLRASEKVTCSAPAATAHATSEYFVSVAAHERHKVHVSIRYHGATATLFEMPAWNALYQVRDFAQYVTGLQAENSRGRALHVTAIDKSSWQVDAGDGCVVVAYDILANAPGPFSAQANDEHVFLNWAQVLMYSPAMRNANLMLTLEDVPQEWSLHDLGLFDETRADQVYRLKAPVPYDHLVDSPVEIGRNQFASFDDGGAHFRLVIDADPADYDLVGLKSAIAKIVSAEMEWMQDHPFDDYTFLLHFPHGPIGGGMEHSYGTAITTPADRLKENALEPLGTVAHEFFHLWNVKRIRPQAMEPVDYEHEQYTRSLWFCEGVTSTVSELMMVRAGLEDEKAYLAHLSGVVTEFESTPAHRSQSPQASSVQAWLEGHPYYRRPERSESYYTSGELIGVLLDLKVRAVTGGRKSLRDLFQYMNSQYAQQDRFYDDEKGVQLAAEAVSGTSFEDFFDRYVRGTDSISYDQFFEMVGLKIQNFAMQASDAGFDASVNFTGLPEVVRITPGSAVEAAGVRVGDTLAGIDNHEYFGDLSSYLAGHKPGEEVGFQFKTRTGRTISVHVPLQESNQSGFALVDLPSVSAGQRAQREAWMRGDDLPAGGTQ
ncbi:MAG TPA: hypothetical protein VGL89_04485 [Candidatus Koribacter sp.]